MAITACIMAWACGTTIYVPEKTYGSDPEMLASLQQGRKLYIAKCSSCHNLYPPQKFDTAKWTHEMDEMKIKAQITEDQAQLILKYLANTPTSKK